MIICMGHNVEQWLEQLMAHKYLSPVTGVFFGQIYANGSRLCLLIDGALEINGFSESSWESLLQQQQRLYPDRLVLGWFTWQKGRFALGEEERLIHSTFFKEDWQVICLIEPDTGEQKFFSAFAGSLSEYPLYLLSLFDEKQKRAEKKVALMKKQKKRKKHSSRRRVWKRIISGCFFVLFIAGLTFAALFFYDSYQDLLTIENLQLMGANLKDMGKNLWLGIGGQ